MALTRNRSASEARIKKSGAASKNAVRSKAADALKQEKRVKATKSGPADVRNSREGLGEMAEVVTRITGWAGGREQALAWYRAQPISAFGDRTAESLVNSGQGAALREYLDSIAVGGFA